MATRHRALDTVFGILILLAVAASLADILAAGLSADWTLRLALMLAGFAFDLAFSGEFVWRLADALSRGEALRYLGRGMGWIDFFSSVPLLVFVSGPLFFGWIQDDFGAIAARGVLGAAKLLKAVRVSRALRLLRVVRLFKGIQFADSVVTQRHVAFVVSTTCAVVIATRMVFSFVAPVSGLADLEEIALDGVRANADRAAAIALSRPLGEAKAEFDAIPGLLAVKNGSVVLYRREGPGGFASEYGHSGYEYVERGSLGVFLSVKNVEAAKATEELVTFAVILLVFLVATFLYGPYFAISVSDPVIVMRKNLEDPAYFLRVRTKEDDEPDEVALLSEAFNERFLPIKAKESGAPAASAISGKELESLLGKDRP